MSGNGTINRTPGQVQGQVQTGKPATTSRTTGTGLIARDGLNIALNQAAQAKSGRLDKGLYSLPEHQDPPNAAELAGNAATTIQGSIEKDEGGFKAGWDNEGLLRSMFGQFGGQEQVADADALVNADRSLGQNSMSPEEADRLNKLYLEAKRATDDLNGKLSSQAIAANDKTVIDFRALFAKNVTPEQTQQAAAGMKMSDPSLSINDNFMAQLVAQIAQIQGGVGAQPGGVFRAMQKVMDNLSLKVDVNANAAKNPIAGFGPVTTGAQAKPAATNIGGGNIPQGGGSGSEV